MLRSLAADLSARRAHKVKVLPLSAQQHADDFADEAYDAEYQGDEPPEDGVGEGMALFEACLGKDDLPDINQSEEAWISPQLVLDPVNIAEDTHMLTATEKDVTTAAARNHELLASCTLSEEAIVSMSEQDYIEIGVTAEDAALLTKAGKGCKLRAEINATNECWRATFAALMWHIRPLDLLQSPESVKMEMADMCWPKKLCTVAKYDVAKWLKEHKSPLDDSTALQRTPSARDHSAFPW